MTARSERLLKLSPHLHRRHEAAAEAAAQTLGAISKQLSLTFFRIKNCIKIVYSLLFRVQPHAEAKQIVLKPTARALILSTL